MMTAHHSGGVDYLPRGRYRRSVVLRQQHSCGRVTAISTSHLLNECETGKVPVCPSCCDRVRGHLNHSGLRNGYSLGVCRSFNYTSDWVVIQSVAEE